MHKTKTFFSTGLLFLFLIPFSFCQTSSPTINYKLDVEEFEQHINNKSNPQLIDVRTPDEYKNGYINGALNVDWNSKEFGSMIEDLDKSQPVFVYCLSGGRSEKAAEQLLNSGFKEVYEMKGGTLAWRKAEKPLVEKYEAPDPEKSIEELRRDFDPTKLLLVDFNAPWCAPCKKMAPELNSLAKNQKDVMQLLKINADEHKNLSTKMEVFVLPTLILYKGDKMVWRHEGYLSGEKILEEILKHNL